MYIIVFKDCKYVRNPDIESAFSLPGENYVFSTARTLQLNTPDGICYYNKNREIEKFRLNHLELIDISRSSSQSPYTFSIYNHNTEKVQQIEKGPSNIEYALPEMIKEIITASNFTRWSDYESMLQVEKYLHQIKDLQSQLETCKKLNEELQNKNNID